ncbi:MAG: hypothetical protein HY889_05880 [Deltaproteobacteria bacterium]|nr:hypothetical protein [Deltaproteobacteria bacterium]
MAKHLNLINTVFIIIIFPVLAFLIKDYLVYRYAAINIPLTKAAASTPSAAPEIGVYAPIVERPVFAPAPLKFRAVAVSDDTGGEFSSSALASLRLIGTFVGRGGLVIVERKSDSVEKTFKVGDNVFDAGVLKEVRKDSAIISSGSRDFTLFMPREAPPRPVAPEALSGEPERGADAKASWNAASVKKTGENAWAVDQKAILHALDNIGSVLTDARLTPAASQGGVEGFLVNEIRPGGIFDTIGLKNGDILKRVNGFEITSPEKAVQVLTGLKGEKRIDLDVVRGGQKMNFHYDIR